MLILDVRVLVIKSNMDGGYKKKTKTDKHKELISLKRVNPMALVYTSQSEVVPFAKPTHRVTQPKNFCGLKCVNLVAFPPAALDFFVGCDRYYIQIPPFTQI